MGNKFPGPAFIPMRDAARAASSDMFGIDPLGNPEFELTAGSGFVCGHSGMASNGELLSPRVTLGFGMEFGGNC